MRSIVPAFSSLTIFFFCISIVNLSAQAPIITNFSPVSGPIGTPVTITGTGFSSIAANNIVYFGDVKATLSGATAISLIVSVPSAATYEPISVTTNNLTSYSSAIFDVTFSTGIDFTTAAFSPKVDYATGNNTRCANITDMDGDGKPDVIALNTSSNTLSVFKNNSSGGNIVLDTKQDFYAGNGTTGAVNLCTSDFDGDGKKDIALTVSNQIFSNQDSIVILRNTSAVGTISLAPRIKLAGLPVGGGAMVLGDVNGDGKPDLILATSSLGTISIYKNTSTPGNISFAARVEITVSGSNTRLAIGDIDSDGKIDIAVSEPAYNIISVFRNTSTIATISFAAKQNFSVGSQPWGIAISDMNGDAKPEIISSSTSTVDVLKNTSTPGTVSFSNVVSFAGPTSGIGDISISDIDGDGKADVAARTGNVAFTLLRNIGTGGTIAFNPKVNYLSTLESENIVIGDLNGDALPDIVISNPTSNNMSVYKNKILDPLIRSFSPVSAGTGTTVSITGVNFTGATNVSFGGVPAASFTIVSPTSITAVVGTGATGNVLVTAAGITTTITGFTYLPPPTITSFTPTSAALAGSITITGTNFTGATTVSFGGTAATSFTVASSTSINAIVGSGTTGNIVVTTPNGAATSTAIFTFLPAPTISSFTPISAGNGSNVTISGANFSGVTGVQFGGTNAASYTVVNATTITARPAKVGSSGAISVITTSGTATLAGFTHIPPPTITDFFPGMAGPGMIINITGTGFTGATAVTFGGLPSTSFTVISSTNISATIGSGASGAIVVNTPGGSASLSTFTFVPKPIITTITPSSSATGSTVTISGSNFTAASEVRFGGTQAASFSVLNDFQISAIVGSGSSGDVMVKTAGGSGTYTGFTYIAPPVIASFSPTTAGFGQTITITGTDFTGVNSVSFGGLQATSFTVVNSTTIKAVVAQGYSGSVTITSQGGTRSLAGFNYVPPPTITSFTPSGGLQGATITINGTNFATATAVNFGGTAAGSFTVINQNTITAVVGSGASGRITVFTSYGTATSPADFYWYYPIPTITSFTPTNASANQTVTITGTDFTGANTVRFGGTNAASFVLESPTSIKAVVGSGSTGSVSLNAYGGGASLAGFTYIPAPVITSFTPQSGVNGTLVTISGSNFTGATLVSFGGVNATSFTVVNSNTITAVVGDGSSGSVVVITPGGTGSLAGYLHTGIISFTPTSGTSGTMVTITGTNLGGTTAVKFGGVAASSFTNVSASSITAVVPNGTTGSLSITTPLGVVSKTGFTYLVPTPVINSFSPTAASSNQLITISGSNFTGATAVSFGGVAATSFTIISDNSISALTANGSSGNVAITTAGGTATLAGFTYTGVTISSFTPSTAASGATVTINGTNLTSVYSIMFGSALADNFTIVNANTITAIVGRGASGSVSVNDVNGSALKPGFNFVQAPAITSISPAIIGQGDEVNINGTNFTNVSTVTLGGTNVASYTVVSSTLIKAIAGTGTSGVVNVVTPGGTAIGTNIFYTRNLCAGASTIFTSDISGTSYQWQLNTGSGFNNLTNNSYYAGVTNSSLQLINAPTSFYGYQYRCVVNGSYSKTIIIRFATTWTGAINSNWGNTGNWGCSTLPDSSTDVKINSGTVILSNDTTVRSLVLKTGANLSVQTGKKLKITGKGKIIAKVALGPAEALLYANTPGLIMLKGEQAVLTIRQITSNLEDTIPTGLTFSSSDASVATFGSDGKVTALQTGVCKVTATNAQGKKMTCQVAVIATTSPLLNEPVFVAFASPLLYINTDNKDKINAWALNRLGQKLTDPVTIVLLSKDLQQQAAANSVVNTEDGMYILTATVGEKALIGGSSAVVYKNVNSTVLGEASPAVIASAIINPPAGIYSVVLEWGKYPMFFTKAGVTSEAVNALVYRMVPYEIMAAGTASGTYGLTISTTEENVNVQSENSTVISSSGNTLTSVAAGVGRWRVVHNNFIGPWYTSQVFMDYSGDWYCASDNYGSNVKLRIPAINPQVIYGGTRGSSINVYDQYQQNSKSVAWAQRNTGTGQRTSNSTGNGSSVFAVEIGPFIDCQFCYATVPMRPAWGCGFLTLQNQNRYGDMIYATPDKFFLSEIGNNGRNIMFVKQPVVFAPVINSFSPTTAAPGTTITITGNNFTGATAVSFGGVTATSFIVVNNTTITAVVGSGASGEIKVISNGGSASINGLTVVISLPAPTITSFTPMYAYSNTSVKIIGTNLTYATSVTFGGIPAISFTIIDAATIEAIVGAGATGVVTIVTPTGSASLSGFSHLGERTNFLTAIVEGKTISYTNCGAYKGSYNSYWGIGGDSLREKPDAQNRTPFTIDITSFGFEKPEIGINYQIRYKATNATEIQVQIRQTNPVTGDYEYGDFYSGSIIFSKADCEGRWIGTVTADGYLNPEFNVASERYRKVTVTAIFDVEAVYTIAPNGCN